MKKVPVSQAVGLTLYHDLTAILAGGAKGVAFKRGHVVCEADIPKLMDIGKYHVFVQEPQDAHLVHEEDAGRMISQAICGPNVHFTTPSEGKYTLYSTIDGLFILERQALRAINLVPDVTVACRPSRTMVHAGERLAGARIIPLSTDTCNVQQVQRIASAACAPVLQVLPFAPLKTGILIVGSEVYDGRIPDAFEPILRKKLSDFGAEVLGVVKCPDDQAFLHREAAAFKEQGAQVLLFTGGMSVDPDDITPHVIRSLCTSFLCQGVPMQPGNMLTMGYWDGTFLMGLPGASMHSDITSADLFLPMVYASLPVTHEDVADLGEGGLCMNCAQCHYPICHFGRK